MMRVKRIELPETALLQTYARRPDCYTDCYVTNSPHPVGLEEFIIAFYQSPLFRGERFILSKAFGAPSTEAELIALARGQAESFAAWEVEDRSPAQILLSDRTGRTRSWLMTRGKGVGSELLFGSAVVPKEHGGELGALFTILLPVHKLYARSLLRAARSTLL